ncbi:chemotaxis protein CheW [Chondromyces apiculatus]|uniref:CheW-like domain-containing protein n=1 Tax=Chondromyces apiculatus DSM 436 TaxID=1192034 RepID=A0A017T7Q1_9BACT|nr:chemotaxis protein CheW [Chondromyces apiculatus]EYF04591.1 Hypothetical protein CAP_4267 [Chondromyces apiculatus DSM 436]
MSEPSVKDPWSEEQRALLETRTRAVAHRAEVAVNVVGTEVLRVLVAGEPCALQTARIRGVAEILRLTPLPHAPPEVAGLTVRGGSVLPVFYLRAVLGLPLSALPEHGRMVLLGAKEEDQLGLVVDAIEGTARLDLSTLREPPPTVAAEVKAVLLGMDPQGTMVLDLDALLASPRLIIDIPLPRVGRS